MLEQLSKKDKQWRQVAFSICKDKTLTDDLVQDMYLKAIKYNKPLNDAYIYFIIRSLFLDHCRKKHNKVSIEELYYLRDKVSTFEVNDTELQILKRYELLDWKQQQLIEESYDKSLRQIEKDFPLINYAYAYRQIQSGIKEVLGNDYNQYKNSRRKK